MFGNLNMSTLSGLAVGILVGVAATLATRSHEAVGAGGGDFGGAWRVVAVPASGDNPAVAWRINSFTGQMEMCAASPGQPKCVALPGPGQYVGQ
ncbi:MAG: hypothetical protein ACM30I_08440 [Gemmatimonas sp.]